MKSRSSKQRASQQKATRASAVKRAAYAFHPEHGVFKIPGLLVSGDDARKLREKGLPVDDPKTIFTNAVIVGDQAEVSGYKGRSQINAIRRIPPAVLKHVSEKHGIAADKIIDVEKIVSDRSSTSNTTGGGARMQSAGRYGFYRSIADRSGQDHLILGRHGNV